MATVLTRAEWGAKAPASASIPFNPANVKGMAVHYTDWPYDFSNHANCAPNLRTLQANAFSRNYRDIEYNFLVCVHGYIFEGRGLKVAGDHHEDTGGANGVTAGDYANLDYVSVSFMSDGTKTVTAEVASAIEQVRGYVLQEFPIATEVWPHQHFVATACPSKPVLDWLATNPFAQGADVMTDAQMAELKAYINERIDDAVAALAFGSTVSGAPWEKSSSWVAGVTANNIKAVLAKAAPSGGTLSDADVARIAKAVLDAEATRLQA